MAGACTLSYCIKMPHSAGNIMASSLCTNEQRLATLLTSIFCVSEIDDWLTVQHANHMDVLRDACKKGKAAEIKDSEQHYAPFCTYNCT